ncbi:MAG TPA: O-antigen ligase family protein [Herpetosiphonaceae bacterium]
MKSVALPGPGWRWRWPATLATLAALALASAALYQPQYIMAPLAGVEPGASFTVTLAAIPALVLLLAALVRPELALCFVVLTAPLFFRARGFWDTQLGIEGKYIPLHEIMLLIALAATGADWLRQRHPQAGTRPGRRELRAMALPALWALAGLIGVAVAGEIGRKAALRELRWMIIEPIIFYALILYWGRRGEIRRHLLWTLVATGVLASIVALLQRYQINLAPDEGLGICNSQFIVEAGGVTRQSSVYCHPNNFALLAERVWPIALVLGAAELIRRGAGGPVERKKLLLAGGFIACCLLIVAAMLLGYSRGARFASAIGLFALAALTRRWPVVIGVGALLAAGLLYSSINGPERLQVKAESTNARLSVWRSSLAMLRDHPIAGIGLDQFYYHFNPAYSTAYIEPALRDDPSEQQTSHPHNLLLDLLLRVGIFGTAVFAALIGRTFGRGWRAWRDPGGAERWLALAALAGLGVGLLHGAVDQTYFAGDLAIITWAFIAIIDGISERQAAAPAPAPAGS